MMVLLIILLVAYVNIVYVLSELFNTAFFFCIQIYLGAPTQLV